MNDFTTKPKPTAAEYLAASSAELLDRLNMTRYESECLFINSLIAVRTAEAQRKTNEALVRQTRHLVYATLAMCVRQPLCLFTICHRCSTSLMESHLLHSQ